MGFSLDGGTTWTNPTSISDISTTQTNSPQVTANTIPGNIWMRFRLSTLDEKNSVFQVLNIGLEVTAENNPGDGGQADGGQADGGQADGGQVDGGQADGGQADGGQADGGQADGGQADGGQADGGQADGGQVGGGQADGGPLTRGDKGDKGEKGDKGDRGDKGNKGSKGERGKKGERGEIGEEGEKGDKGQRGRRGQRGREGKKGERGEIVVVLANDRQKVIEIERELKKKTIAEETEIELLQKQNLEQKRIITELEMKETEDRKREAAFEKEILEKLNKK